MLVHAHDHDAEATGADRPRSRRASVALAATLGAAGLAALPVAADLGEADVAVGDARFTSHVEGGSASNHGLDRWYSADESADLAPDAATVRVTMADAESDEEAPDEADVEPASHDPGSGERTRWDRLADCESGEWVDGGADFIEGSARWDYGIDFAHEGYEQFQGGLNFEPGTWDAFRDPDMPDHAGNATREQEIVVAERVLAEQGWQAWPRCSEMVGLR